MILINNIIVQDDVFEDHFSCNLNACKGACCWEGDYGAPLSKEEQEIIEKLDEIVAPYLDERSLKLLSSSGGATYYNEPKFMGTTLHPDGSCVYLAHKDGISLCSIEQAGADFYEQLKEAVKSHES